MATFKEIAKQINKKYKSGDVLVSGDFLPRVQKLKMGTLGADYPLWGGLPYGTIVVFAGQYSSGKTTAAVQAMANYQKENPDKICVYVDVENTLPVQLDHLKRMTGLQTDEDHFVIYNTVGKSAEMIFEDIIDLQNEVDNIGMIILDSAAALVSDTDLQNDFSKDNGMRASVAKSLGKFCKMMNVLLPRKNNLLLIINQVRDAGKTFTGAQMYSEPCGHALDFYPSLKVRFGTRTFTREEDTNVAASKAEESDGFRLKFAITKNKAGSLARGGGFLTYRFGTGLDVLNDTVEVAGKYGFIEHPNNLTYILTDLDTGEVFTDESGNILKFAGRAKMLDYLKSHKEFTDKYIEMLDRHIDGSAGVSLLDDASLKEIQDEENAVSGKQVKSDVDEA